MSLSNWQRARKMAGAGRSAADIRKATTLTGEQARGLVSRTSAASATDNTSSNTVNPVEGTNTSTSWSPSDFTGIFQTLQTGQENLAHIQGDYSLQAAQAAANAQVSSAGIRADADKEVAKAYADAQRYGSELGLEGVKYGADKESQWREAVANIEVKGKLDLQPIINAGLERVAGIEAQASRDVAETTGKYSLESMKERTAADKSIGKMQLAGGMYGLLGSIFG